MILNLNTSQGFKIIINLRNLYQSAVCPLQLLFSEVVRKKWKNKANYKWNSQTRLGKNHCNKFIM